ncbi:hypothetical protein ACLOAU_00715 [Niabella sp. CJ426]|uniref:hypothetical protein n=1 Tax=Niabella sp. CJ426 TaxID=3393740 RepID=UPI003CFCDE82
MKYCSETTTTHPTSVSCPHCVNDFNDLLSAEGYIASQQLFNMGEVVLNLDCVEATCAAAAGLERAKSMDLAFGISDLKKECQLMVLVEIRLNYQNPNNVRRDKLHEKVLGSIAALGSHLPIYANYIFVFREDKKQEARNRFFRMNPKIPNEYLVMDLDELKATFF